MIDKYKCRQNLGYKVRLSANNSYLNTEEIDVDSIKIKLEENEIFGVSLGVPAGFILDTSYLDNVL